MVIHINPNRINTTPSGQRKLREREAGSSQTEKQQAPARAEINYIPEPESLATMIRSAIASFRSGKFWDRGTILNLLA